MNVCLYCGQTNDLHASYCQDCGHIPPSSNPNTSMATQIQSPSSSQQSMSINVMMSPVFDILSEGAIVEVQDSSEMFSHNEKIYENSQLFSSIKTQHPQVAPFFLIPLVARKRSVGGTILSTVLYIIGLGMASFGSLCFVLAFTMSALPAVFFCVVLLAGLIVLALVVARHKKPLIKWWVRPLAMLGLIVAGFIIFIIAEFAIEATLNSQEGFEACLGGTLIVIGAIISVISVL